MGFDGRDELLERFAGIRAMVNDIFLGERLFARSNNVKLKDVVFILINQVEEKALSLVPADVAGKQNANL